jgi:hypothetical protein
MNEEPRAALGPVADALDALKISYRVGGSIASSALGVARSTVDVDIVADLRLAHVGPLVARLEADYYIDADMIRDAIRRRSSFNVIHLPTMMKVDVFIVKVREFDQAAFARVTNEPISDDDPRLFPLTTAEDVILHKLEWYRIGGGVSERQWDDVLGVMRIQGELLDRAYLERWARELGIDDLLQRAWEEAAAL